VNNNEIHHIRVGTRHKETHDELLNIQGRRKRVRKSSGGVRLLEYNIIMGKIPRQNPSEE
jgi:hypothetical protein